MKPIDRKITRIMLGIRQVDAARAVGCNRSTISFMENDGYDVPEKFIAGYERFLRRTAADKGINIAPGGTRSAAAARGAGNLNDQS